MSGYTCFAKHPGVPLSGHGCYNCGRHIQACGVCVNEGKHPLCWKCEDEVKRAKTMTSLRKTLDATAHEYECHLGEIEHTKERLLIRDFMVATQKFLSLL